MSFDPFGQDQPSPSGQGRPSEADDFRPARDRVQLPAVFLIAVGVLNLLVSFYFAFNTATTAMLSDEQLDRMRDEQAKLMKRIFPDRGKEIDEQLQKGTAADTRRQMMLVSGGLTAGTLIPALLVLIGGIRLIQLRSYGLCVLAAITAAVPCLSPVSCCCIGEVAGIWALVVLLGEEVRAGFR